LTSNTSGFVDTIDYLNKTASEHCLIPVAVYTVEFKVIKDDVVKTYTYKVDADERAPAENKALTKFEEEHPEHFKETSPWERLNGNVVSVSDT